MPHKSSINTSAHTIKLPNPIIVSCTPKHIFVETQSELSTKYKFLDPSGTYFVTFTVVEWVDVFTRELYRKIIIESLSHCIKNKGMILHAWCLMTNHVHLIFSAEIPGSHSSILRDLKKFTSKEIIQAIECNPKESRKKWMLPIFIKYTSKKNNTLSHQFWQYENHPIEIYSPRIIQRKLNYLHQNPVVAGFVEKAEHYIYSSARDYSGRKGMIDVQLIKLPNSLSGYIHLA